MDFTLQGTVVMTLEVMDLDGNGFNVNKAGDTKQASELPLAKLFEDDDPWGLRLDSRFTSTMPKFKYKTKMEWHVYMLLSDHLPTHLGQETLRRLR